MEKKKVLVLCTGNSCRSIMAEAIINFYLGDLWEAFSAGLSPSRVHPRAELVLRELGIDTSGLRSKSVAEFLNQDDLDLVITVCDHAWETCPVFLKPVEQVHIGIDDPVSQVFFSETSALDSFRRTREQIRAMILGYLESRS